MRSVGVGVSTWATDLLLQQQLLTVARQDGTWHGGVVAACLRLHAPGRIMRVALRAEASSSWSRIAPCTCTAAAPQYACSSPSVFQHSQAQSNGRLAVACTLVAPVQATQQAAAAVLAALAEVPKTHCNTQCDCVAAPPVELHYAAYHLHT